MKVTKITIETVRLKGIAEPRENVVILWTEDGIPHTLPDIDNNAPYPTQLAVGEVFEIIKDVP